MNIINKYYSQCLKMIRSRTLQIYLLKVYMTLKKKTTYRLLLEALFFISYTQ